MDIVLFKSNIKMMEMDKIIKKKNNNNNNKRINPNQNYQSKSKMLFN
jgi:hypothetical protein